MDLDAMERDAGAASRLATGMRSSHINFWTLGDCDLVASLAGRRCNRINVMEG